MGAHNHADLVLLEEFVHDVRAVAHNVVSLGGVPDRVLLHSNDFIAGCGVGPHYVHAHLLDSVSDAAKSHAQRSLNLVNVLQFDDGVTDATMDTQDTILGHFVLNDGT